MLLSSSFLFAFFLLTPAAITFILLTRAVYLAAFVKNNFLRSFLNRNRYQAKY
jgi:hypothetical protein